MSDAARAPPKTSNKIKRAATTPTRTELPGLGRSQLLMAGPPNETCTSGPSADSAVWTSWPASAVVIDDVCLLQVTVAKATVPSRLIWDAPLGLNGLLTAATPGTRATLARAPVTAARTCGKRTVVPCVAWMTTWSLSPEAAGKFFSSRVTAAWESVPGRLRLSLKLVPVAPEIATTATSAASQPASTTFRCVKHQRPSRDSSGPRFAGLELCTLARPWVGWALETVVIVMGISVAESVTWRNPPK